MKNHLPLLFSLLFLFLFSCSDDVSGGASEGELKVLSGTFVREDKNPVEGASVRIFTESDNKVVDSTETDNKGYYEFKNLNSGTYGIDAIYTEGDTLVAQVSNINYVLVYDVGEKVMKAPGAISGQVTFDAVDKGGVDCYLEGTSYSAKSDENGYYTISSVIAGEYELVFEKSSSLFAKKRYGKVAVISDSILSIETVELEYDTAKAPPAPKNVTATYNATTGMAKINWATVPVSDLAGYVLFGTGNDGITKQLSTAIITDTVYEDSLWKRVFGNDNKSFSYQLKSQDLNNNVSDLLSEKVTLEPTSGPNIDTSGIDDTIDDKGNKAVTDGFIDTLYTKIDTALDFGQNVLEFKLAFSDKFLNAKQFTHLIELFDIEPDWEEVVYFAYPTKMINPEKIYSVLVNDPNRIFLKESFLDTLVVKPPLFQFDAEAELMSSATLNSVSAALHELPMDYEKAGVAKLAIKYEHISEEQLAIILSQIGEGEHRDAVRQYAQGHLVK